MSRGIHRNMYMTGNLTPILVTTCNILWIFSKAGILAVNLILQ